MNDYRKPYQDTSDKLQTLLENSKKTLENSLLKAEKIEQEKSKLVKEYEQILVNWLNTLQQTIPYLRSHSSKLKDAKQQLYKVKRWDNWWKPVFLARMEIIFLYLKIWINIVLLRINTLIDSVLHFLNSLFLTTIDPETLKRLHNPNAPVIVKFWLNSKEDLQLNAGDEVKFYYEISYNKRSKDLNHKTHAYFSLFKISPTGLLSIIVDNKAVKANKVYLLSDTHTDWQQGKQLVVERHKLLYLQKGQEYFKAIVTSQRIALEADIEKKLQRVAFWGTWELTVAVD